VIVCGKKSFGLAKLQVIGSAGVEGTGKQQTEKRVTSRSIQQGRLETREKNGKNNRVGY